MKRAIGQIRMPNAERNPKSEARGQRRSVGTLGSPGNTQEAREEVCGSAGRMGGNTSDFGFRNSFGIRISVFGFHDAKTSGFP